MMVSTVVMGFPSERPPPFLQTRRTSARSRWELSKREAPQVPLRGFSIHRRGWVGLLEGGWGHRAVWLTAGECGGSPSRHRVKKEARL